MVMEMSKATKRRYNIGEFHSKYFIGNGIDIGCGPDSLGKHMQFFPAIVDVRPWDQQDGDGQLLESVDNEFYDFLVSSHCLEHLVDPYIALNNWVRVVKPGGYIIFTIPDEDLYEMGVFPSRLNGDHKHSFTIQKEKSWSTGSINVFDLLAKTHNIQVIKVELLEDMYDFTMQKNDLDQTANQLGAESAIEIILRKL